MMPVVEAVWSAMEPQHPASDVTRASVPRQGGAIRAGGAPS